MAEPARARRFSSIRFRLSLAFASAVFALGSILVGGIYLFQQSRLDDPSIDVFPVVVLGEDGDRRVEYRAPRDEIERFAVERIQTEIDRAALDRLRRGSIAALAALAIASFLAGWVLAGWALRPVNRIVRVARDISTTDLSRRIELTGPDDELRDIADTFDAMLDRLQGGFHDQQRFMADASHELRNPLAIIRTHLELAADGDDDERAHSLSVAEAAAERLGALVDDLMVAARATDPTREAVPVELGELVHAVARDFRPAAADRDIDLLADVSAVVGEPAVVRGDDLALRRSIANLVANAIRLAPADTRVTIELHRLGDRARIDVVDEGPGIAPADRELVFQRFWRGADAGRGTGLGLSIVRDVAERHGGNATLTAEDGGGSRFSVWLPISQRTAG